MKDNMDLVRIYNCTWNGDKLIRFYETNDIKKELEFFTYLKEKDDKETFELHFVDKDGNTSEYWHVLYICVTFDAAGSYNMGRKILEIYLENEDEDKDGDKDV